AYVTWDDTNVYLAISGSDIASGNGERIVSFYLGTGGTPGTTAGYLHNTQQSTLPFEATHYLLWSADNAFMELYNTDGLVWVVIPSHGVMAYQLDTFVEFAVPLSSLGASAPFTLELTGSMQSTTSGSEWTFAGYPQSSFTDQYNPVFSGYYQFQIGGPLAPGDYTPLP
ncbi:hypothetical protein KJ865_07155, partial [Myxococcota bacterium]|nr:hypothetical protein [Myxococcota bacterium]